MEPFTNKYEAPSAPNYGCIGDGEREPRGMIP